MSAETLKIVTALKAVIQKEVSDRFGGGRFTNRGTEEVKKFAQERLDQYINEMKKSSPELAKMWSLGHPFLAQVHLSVQTRSYAVEITAK